MRKLYSFLAFVVMMLVSMTASAWSFDMQDENAVLQSEAYNYRLFKNYNFFGGTYNGEPFTDDAGNTVSGDGCFTQSPDKASFKLNGFDTYNIIAPVQMNNFYIQIGTGAINLRAGVNKDGLHNYGSGSRFFAIADVKAGQIIVCQWGVTSSRESVVQPGSAITDATACTWEDISEEIHAIQNESAEKDEEGNVISGGADSFSYWRATADGYFVVELQRDCCIQGLQIWIDAAATEAVSAPSLKMAKVNGVARLVEFTPGESTFGAECKTYWGVVDLEETALYLKETEDIDHYDEVVTTDPETGEETVEQVPVYKKVIDMEAVEAAGGFYGDRLFAGDLETIDSSMDADGDGYVTIEAATVSANGAYSDIVTLNISIGEIQLNTPTLTLVGLNGTERSYTIGWTNNTLCKEDYIISYESDNGEGGAAFDPNTGIGETITATQNIKLTVSVHGYLDGELVQDVLAVGTDFKRKNDAESHDWDFVNITEEQQKIIRGEMIESCYIIINAETEEKAYYTVEEYENGVAADGTDLSDAIPVYTPSCWGWDGSKSRATLNVADSADENVDPSTLHNLNANGHGYVNDAANIFHDLNIDCAPNANNASCIFMYINGDLGAYFMARPTITFSPKTVSAGEYVLIYKGKGGSNWTDWRAPSLYEVPAGELLSVTLESGGVHVFYIDIYTYEGLPESEDVTEKWNEAVNISSIGTAVTPITGYYSLSGAKLAAPQKGVNVVKFADGTTMKVLVK